VFEWNVCGGGPPEAAHRPPARREPPQLTDRELSFALLSAPKCPCLHRPRLSPERDLRDCLRFGRATRVRPIFPRASRSLPTETPCRESASSHPLRPTLRGAFRADALGEVAGWRCDPSALLEGDRSRLPLSMRVETRLAASIGRGASAIALKLDLPDAAVLSVRNEGHLADGDGVRVLA